jgi:hypothetical protein
MTAEQLAKAFRERLQSMPAAERLAFINNINSDFKGIIANLQSYPTDEPLQFATISKWVTVKGDLSYQELREILLHACINIENQWLNREANNLTYKQLKDEILPLVKDEERKAALLVDWLKKPGNNLTHPQLKNEILPFIKQENARYSIINNWLSKTDCLISIRELQELLVFIASPPLRDIASYILLSKPIFRKATIKRIKDKYKGIRIAVVKNVDELTAYLKVHPPATKIGFVLYHTFFASDHYTPVFYVRDNANENYILLDSTATIIEPLPTVHGNTSTMYYYPLCRQHSKIGCFEDAVIMAAKCYKHPNILQFCTEHSKLDRNIYNPLTENEKVNHNRLYEKSTLTKLTPEEDRIFLEYQNRAAFCKPTKPTNNTKVRILTSLPAGFLPSIERYSTMRHFLEKEPQKLEELYKPGETVGAHIKRKAIYRIAAQPDLPLAKLNDIKAVDFADRAFRWAWKLAKQSNELRRLLDGIQDFFRSTKMRYHDMFLTLSPIAAAKEEPKPVLLFDIKTLLTRETSNRQKPAESQAITDLNSTEYKPRGILAI